MHFLSHRRSPWVIALTWDPRIIESAGHFCEPHIHRLAQPGELEYSGIALMPPRVTL